MMARWRRTTTACERAGQWISLRLDGELSELEQLALDRHVEECAACRAFGADLSGIALLLRDAPLAELAREPVVVSPRRARRRMVGGIGVAAAFATAAAAVAAILLTGSVPEQSGGRAYAFRSTQEQMRFVHVEQLRMEPTEYVPVVSVAARYAARSL
jgi:predicted anti-sigma-YlaC factor YlaD